MTLFNAELTKISFNAFITMKISFANIFAEICEHMPHGNVDIVTQALGFESRISPKCLSSALSYGGPCFPRDNKAFSSFAKNLGCRAKLSEITDEVNEEQTERIVRLVQLKLGGVKDNQ